MYHWQMTRQIHRDRETRGYLEFDRREDWGLLLNVAGFLGT
jgi:hypothetical protein